MDSDKRIEELITVALRNLEGFCVSNEVKPNSIVVILTHCLLNMAMALADMRGTKRDEGLKKLLAFVEREGKQYVNLTNTQSNVGTKES